MAFLNIPKNADQPRLEIVVARSPLCCVLLCPVALYSRRSLLCLSGTLSDISAVCGVLQHIRFELKIEHRSMATPVENTTAGPAGAVCDPVTGVCRLPTRAGTSVDAAGLIPLPRTLRPLAVLEDEDGNAVDPSLFKGKVRKPQSCSYEGLPGTDKVRCSCSSSSSCRQQ